MNVYEIYMDYIWIKNTKPSKKSLVERVKSPIDIAVDITIDLYEGSINKKIVSYDNQYDYIGILRDLSKKEKIKILARLNQQYPGAACYFSQKFMFGVGAQNIKK